MLELNAILVAKEVMIFREESYNGVRERATRKLSMLKGVFILIYCLSLSIANFLVFFI